MYFTDFDFEDEILDALDAMRFETCTPIQEQTIQPLLDGRDLIGVAQTGTGKTAAYLLPVLNKLCRGGYPEDAINCIIMAPTRELAQQIDRQLEGFTYFMSVSSVAVYGGNDGMRYEQELRGMSRGADIIVATPGRLISHINLGNINLSRVSFFILDEADRMLDMGFYNDIMTIAKQLPTKKQTMLFSATMPQEIRRLASNLLTNPVHITLSLAKPADGIKQQAYVCYEPQKTGIIKELFANEKPERVILFTSRKNKVKDISIALKKRGYNVGEMHSNLTQSERDDIMYRFKSRQIDIVVATDILARGIDIDDIRLVINFDVPRDCDDYIHRVGRTARAGSEGRAVTLISVEDQHYFKRIEDFMEQTVEKLPVPIEFGEAPEYNPGSREKASSKENSGNKTKRRRSNSKQHPKKRNSKKPASDTSTNNSIAKNSNAAQSHKNSRNHRRNRQRNKSSDSGKQK
ncbi:MAG: DEAD/DEAH box helicase [Bacteroidaceae bacterium]|nr:DEAD/DEAH box helicase [Bacteroidaceae bacterium]